MSTEETKKPQDNRTLFTKFRDITKSLFAVPKKELDEKLEEFKNRPQKKRAVR